MGCNYFLGTGSVCKYEPERTESQEQLFRSTAPSYMLRSVMGHTIVIVAISWHAECHVRDTMGGRSVLTVTTT